MIEKFKEAAAALREAADNCTQAAADCTSRAADYLDLADRLDAITLTRGEIVGQLKAAAAKPRTRRGTAPKAGRKAKARKASIELPQGGGIIAEKGKPVRFVGPDGKEVKPNGHGHPEAAPEPEKAAPASDVPRTPNGKIVKGALDAHVIKHVAAHPGMRCSELARVFSTTPGNLSHLLKRLVREGRIVREGGGFHPVEAEAHDAQPADATRARRGDLWPGEGVGRGHDRGAPRGVQGPA